MKQCPKKLNLLLHIKIIIKTTNLIKKLKDTEMIDEKVK
jgi:hypothetical protein